jgi:hypothetical protein
MTIPKTLQVYGKRWQIKTKKFPAPIDDEPGTEGLCCKESRVIYIERTLSGEEKLNTFLHEIIHAINYELKLGQTSLSSDVEEVICQGIADFFCENFRLTMKNK